MSELATLYRTADLRLATAAAASRDRARALPDAPAKDSDFRLVVDLGAKIGSRDWLRGLGTVIALCWGAASFWPDMSAVRGPVPAPFTDLEAEEAAAFAITPIANGSTTGRHSGATDAVQTAEGITEPASLQLRASLATNGDLAGALSRAGVSASDAAQVVALVGRAVTVADLPPAPCSICVSAAATGRSIRVRSTGYRSAPAWASASKSSG